MAEAGGADAIDLNMGCPSRKVTDTGAGADLMRFPEKIEGILRGVRRSIRCPLTIKIRSGWDADHVNAIEISKIAEDSGVDAITLHPRTRDQWFHGKADWKVIGEVKRAIRIPVIGNGDVTTPYLVEKMLEETGCDGVMIGKGPSEIRGSSIPGIDGPSKRERPSIPPWRKEKRVERHYLLFRVFMVTRRQ